MAIKPVLHRLIVKPDVLEKKDEVFAKAVAAGLDVSFATETQREQAAIDTGQVTAIGETAFRDFGADNPVKVGDYIVFAKYGGKAIVDPDTKEKYIALNDEDVIAILTKEGA
jgi:co-chaperonin GroES (HSP10)